MFKIAENWAIEKDVYCFMLKRRAISKNKGQETWAVEGYYSNIPQALAGLLNKELLSEQKTAEFEQMYKASLERIENMVEKGLLQCRDEEISNK
jgi:hypothetical protein